MLRKWKALEAQGGISFLQDEVYTLRSGGRHLWRQVDAVEHLTRQFSLFLSNKDPLDYPLEWILSGRLTQV